MDIPGGLEREAERAGGRAAGRATDVAERAAGDALDEAMAPGEPGAGDSAATDEGAESPGGEGGAGEEPAAGGAQQGSAAAAPVKAFIETERGDSIECLFNPAEFTIAKSNQWSEVTAPGRNTPKLTFAQGQAGTITMELTLDTTATGEAVTKHTTALLALMKIDSELPDANSKTNSARPPFCVFHWGSFHSFKAIIQSLTIRFTYFAGDGTPLRAKAQVTFKQYEDEDAYGPQNPSSGTPETHAVHWVSAGETLDRIAASRYGDPSRWRLLADANGVVDPLELEPGTPLVVPDPQGVGRG